MNYHQKECLNYAKNMKFYGRDYLLQLRFHPLALRKPQTNCLPGFKIVKEKLTLQIFDAASKEFYIDGLLSFQDSEYDQDNEYSCSLSTSEISILFPALSYDMDYLSLSKMPLSYQSIHPSLKIPFHNEASTGLLENGVNSTCNLPYENFSKSASNDKKYLPIIDPETGKNILDSINAGVKEINASLLGCDKAKESKQFSEILKLDDLKNYEKFQYMQDSIDSNKSNNEDSFSSNLKYKDIKGLHKQLLKGKYLIKEEQQKLKQCDRFLQRKREELNEFAQFLQQTRQELIDFRIFLLDYENKLKIKEHDLLIKENFIKNKEKFLKDKERCLMH